ncbi:hypothetical protein ACOMHN_051535 [Nucella lapillus]
MSHLSSHPTTTGLAFASLPPSTYAWCSHLPQTGHSSSPAPIYLRLVQSSATDRTQQFACPHLPTLGAVICHRQDTAVRLPPSTYAWCSHLHRQNTAVRLPPSTYAWCSHLPQTGHSSSPAHHLPTLGAVICHRQNTAVRLPTIYLRLVQSSATDRTQQFACPPSTYAWCSHLPQTEHSSSPAPIYLRLVQSSATDRTQQFACPHLPTLGAVICTDRTQQFACPHLPTLGAVICHRQDTAVRLPTIYLRLVQSSATDRTQQFACPPSTYAWCSQPHLPQT